jgi:hypothetical protein
MPMEFYKYAATVFDAFTQFKFSYDKIDFYLAQSFSSTNYQREGMYKMEFMKRFPSVKARKPFENFGFKGGIHLKFQANH